MNLCCKLLRDSLPWFSLWKAGVTQAGEQLTFLFPRHHHPTLVELHGVRCDAHSCSVAATGGVLVPATAAPEQDWSSGQRAVSAHWTHREGGRFFFLWRGMLCPRLPNTKAMASMDRSTGACELFSLYNPCSVFHVADTMWAEDSEQTGCSTSNVAHHYHVSVVAPEHSLVLKRVKRGVVGSHKTTTILCLFSVRTVYLQRAQHLLKGDACARKLWQHQHHHTPTSALCWWKAVSKSSLRICLSGSPCLTCFYHCILASRWVTRNRDRKVSAQASEQLNSLCIVSPWMSTTE